MTPISLKASASIVEACERLGVVLSKQPTIELLESGPAEFELLSLESSGLQLRWHCDSPRPINFTIDFVLSVQRIRSFPVAKQGAFNQALGKKTRRVLDLSGGFGGDAFLMFSQGYSVDVIERLPLMAVLLGDAFSRLAQANPSNIMAPRMHFADSIAYLTEKGCDVDCLYFDPMFPPKRKKSAASNKNMQLLQRMAGPDLDAAEVAAKALTLGKRLVVKRPSHAQPLIAEPDQRLSSKLVAYDVYLPRAV